jgi:NADH dehydrogenase
MTRILILGGGFAGVYAALEMERKLARRKDVEITLVNRENFILFTPMLHEVAASDLHLTHIVNPLRKMLRHVKFLQASVKSIDCAARCVTVSHGSDSHSHDLPYDHLVIGLGSTTNFFNLPGLEKHSLTMKTLGDAIRLRNLLIERLEESEGECAAGSRQGMLTVVVAGGGFSGAETVAGINDFLRESVRFYPHLRENAVRVVLVHPGSVILPELGPELGAYAQQKLKERGVEILVNTRVLRADAAGVDLSDGQRIQTHTIVWTAGTSPSSLLATLPFEKEKGRLKTDPHMRVLGTQDVWALGDCASIPDLDTGTTFAPTAQNAIRQGVVLARNVQASIDNGTLKPFRFRTLGLLAAIGRRTGVANILGLQFSGFVAWFLWRTVYLSKLPGVEKKVRVALDWTLDLVFTKDIVQFQTQAAETLTTAEHEALIAAGHV